MSDKRKALAVIGPKVLVPTVEEKKKRRPRTAPLPGMDEPRIEKIRDLALRYFDRLVEIEEAAEKLHVTVGKEDEG
jgi:hypothetical protein